MKKKDRNSFGGKLNSILWEREMTMTELAKRTGAAGSTVFYMVGESRPPRLDLFGIICDALELDDKDVLDLVNTFRNGK